MSEGRFKTRKKAENYAAKMRRRYPRIRPIRVVKADIGWDVVVPR